MKVRVQNFQSIEDVKLDVAGFTLLVGESSQGKSATFRALQASVSNRFRAGQVRNGTPQAEVAIKFAEGDVLKVIKPADSSASMKLNNTSYSKLARTVPKEVAEVCNMESLASDREAYSLNFHPQFEEPMLLGFSQQKVIELLSASEALDDLNMCKGGLLEKRTENKGAFNSLDAILSSMKIEVDRMEGVANKMTPLVGNLRNSYEDYKGLLDRMDKLNTLISYKDSIGVLIEEQGKLEEIVDHLSSVPDESLGLINQLVSLRNDLEYTEGLKVVYYDSVDKLSEIVGLEDEISRIDDRLGDISRCESWLSIIDENKNKRKELIGVVKEGKCPICGKKIGECQDEY